VKLTPKKWEEFQHYKDRSPTWIKLHKALLDDYDFACLPVASRALAPMLWLLASEYQNGVIDATLEKLAFRFRMTPGDMAEALNPLIEAGFFSVEQDASKPLAEPEQVASLEKRREELEKEKNIGAVANATRPKDVENKFEEFWKAYPKRKGDNPKAPARKSFFALVKQGVDPDAIIRGVKRATEKNRERIGTEFIPQTIKWLRDRRWEDYSDETEPIAGFVLSLRTPEQTRAWLLHKTDAGENISFLRSQIENGKSITVPSEYPPGHERAA
jgi:DNA-binding MarR family transcriptional regulator